jgi:hypothetical protein
VASRRFAELGFIPHILVGLVVLAIGLASVAFWEMGNGVARQACISDALARYPAVPVSAYNGSVTGPLKLSFVVERQQALIKCS